MPSIVSVNSSATKGTIKTPIHTGRLIAHEGLEGDAHAGNAHRQVSLLAVESIRQMEQLGVTGLGYGSFAENLTTEGITLHTLPVGTLLRIGATLHKVTQIGKVCHHHCAIYQQIGQCIMPTEGIFTEVLEGGMVQVGDCIEVQVPSKEVKVK